MTQIRSFFAPNNQTRNSQIVFASLSSSSAEKRHEKYAKGFFFLKLSRVKWLSSAAPEEKEKISYARHRTQDDAMVKMYFWMFP